MSTYVIKNEFPKLAVKLAAAGKVAENAGAKAFAQIAQANAPVRTGDLKRSISAHGNVVTASSGHALYQQFGTVKMRARPFFWNGVRATQAAVMAVLRAVLR